MSKLSKKDLHTPFSGPTLSKVMAYVLGLIKSEQKTAADLSASLMVNGIITQDRKVRELWCQLSAQFEASETMTIDVLVNGVSILDSVLSLDGTSDADTQIPFTLSSAFIDAGQMLYVGDVVTVTRNWTTGGGVDTTPANVVVMEAA